MSGASTTIGEEVQRAIEDGLRRVADAFAQRVYSPRIQCLSIEDVCKVTGLGKSVIYQMIKDGEFPKPLEGFKSNRWREGTIAKWMDEHDPNLRKGGQ